MIWVEAHREYPCETRCGDDATMVHRLSHWMIDARDDDIEADYYEEEYDDADYFLDELTQAASGLSMLTERECLAAWEDARPVFGFFGISVDSIALLDDDTEEVLELR